jgi:SAM-dependent methyltransferase
MDFSLLVPEVLKPHGRRRVARQILALLNHVFSHATMKQFTVLDLGCSSGLITEYLRPHFKSIIGIDIDKNALPKRKNYILMDASDLQFPKSTFDVVICNQVYYWFKNPEKLMSEIYRVLKPGGVCVFIHVNKYVLFEPQYRKPFISFLPRSLTLLIEPRYDCYYLSYWQLLDLCRNFTIHHYTPRVFLNPKKYHFTRLYKYGFLLQHLPSIVYRLAEPLAPNLIWLLEKPPLD